MSDPSKRQSYQHHAAGLTGAERQLAHRLDEFGEAERAAAPSGFEERLLKSTRAHLPPPRSLGGRSFFLGSPRLAWCAAAACLALASGIGWVVSGPFAATGPTPTRTGSQVAIAELEAEVGFTLDALLAAYDFENVSSRENPQQSANTDPDPFWESAADDDFFEDLEAEIAL